MNKLKIILNDNLINRYDEWEKYASQQEIDGLNCLEQIFLTKGIEILSSDLIVKNNVVDVNELDYKKLDYNKSKDFLREKNMSSNYKDNYGRDVNNTFGTNLLKLTKVSEMNYDKFLNPLSIDYIDKWTNIENDLSILNAVLATLRSLNVRYLATEPNKTETKSIYS